MQVGAFKITFLFLITFCGFFISETAKANGNLNCSLVLNSNTDLPELTEAAQKVFKNLVDLSRLDLY